LTFPCAHAEGNLRYVSIDGFTPALYYPPDENPDGSMDNIAGITSPDGLIFGLMNHPERALFREENLEIFRNAVRWS
jgi:phosphoribosylformylglycinamidine synthase